MNNVDDRLRSAAAETRRVAEHRKPGKLPLEQHRSLRGPVVLVAAFVIVIGVFGVLPLLLDTTVDNAPIGSASPPVTDPTVPPSTVAADSSTVASECSSDGGPTPLADSTLPADVAATRETLIQAAIGCDFEALTAIAGESFTANFGGGGAEMLERWEDEGVGQLATLLTLFDMSYGVVDDGNGGEIYVWPAAHSYDSWDEIPAEATTELEAIHSPDEIETMRQAGAYLGWRTGIHEDGDWMFLVAGD